MTIDDVAIKPEWKGDGLFLGNLDVGCIGRLQPDARGESPMWWAMLGEDYLGTFTEDEARSAVEKALSDAIGGSRGDRCC